MNDNWLANLSYVKADPYAIATHYHMLPTRCLIPSKSKPYILCMHNRNIIINFKPLSQNTALNSKNRDAAEIVGVCFPVPGLLPNDVMHHAFTAPRLTALYGENWDVAEVAAVCFSVPGRCFGFLV